MPRLRKMAPSPIMTPDEFYRLATTPYHERSFILQEKRFLRLPRFCFEEILRYLTDIGELVYYGATEGPRDIVVLDPAWLAASVLGVLLSPDRETLASVYTRAGLDPRPDGIIARADLVRVLAESTGLHRDQIGRLVDTLRRMDLCVVHDASMDSSNPMLLVPGLLQATMPSSVRLPEPAACYQGRRLRLGPHDHALSAGFFPRLQSKLHDLLFTARMDLPDLWVDGLYAIWADDNNNIIHMLVSVTENGRAIDFWARTMSNSAAGLMRALLDKATELAYLACNSSATGFTAWALSPIDLRSGVPRPREHPLDLIRSSQPDASFRARADSLHGLVEVFETALDILGPEQAQTASTAGPISVLARAISTESVYLTPTATLLGTDPWTTPCSPFREEEEEHETAAFEPAMGGRGSGAGSPLRAPANHDAHLRVPADVHLRAPAHSDAHLMVPTYQDAGGTLIPISTDLAKHPRETPLAGPTIQVPLYVPHRSFNDLRALPSVPPHPVPPGVERHAYLSHSQRDAAIARAVAHSLIMNGVTVWLLERDRRPGGNAKADVENAVRQSGLFVCLVSANYIHDVNAEANAMNMTPLEFSRAIEVHKGCNIVMVTIDSHSRNPASWSGLLARVFSPYSTPLGELRQGEIIDEMGWSVCLAQIANIIKELFPSPIIPAQPPRPGLDGPMEDMHVPPTPAESWHSAAMFPVVNVERLRALIAEAPVAPLPADCQYHAFLGCSSHTDMYGRDSHFVAMAIAAGLVQRGLRVFFDELSIDSHQRREVSGIEHSCVYVGLVCGPFVEKIRCGNLADDCLMGFEYAFAKRTPARMLMIPLEDTCTNATVWTGTLYLAAGLHKYPARFDPTVAGAANVAAWDRQLDRLANAIRARTGLRLVNYTH
eukprot:m.115266 g.115266  ORF g.115266 m.115266 type:complete len:891 (-) comp9168_c0_seq1:77-2749(-)